LYLWACALIACPFISFLAVSVAGSDGTAPKFFFLFLVLPALLAAGAGWLLPVRRLEAVGAVIAATALTGGSWLAFLIALDRSGVFD